MSLAWSLVRSVCPSPFLVCLQGPRDHYYLHLYLSSSACRAPEIILGAKHTPALDMWSIACCLFELYTGHPLFPGDDNNDMLWRFQCLRGRFPNRLTKAHLRACETLGIPSHFDADLKFRRNVLDPVSACGADLCTGMFFFFFFCET